MKKTVHVNVGGFAFVMEEVAYEQLSMYLNNVRRNLGNDVDANEVMNDIESRIAELFREALRTSGKEVVDTSLIDQVVLVMGKPEDYGDGTENTKTQEQTYQEPTQRTLFRDGENKMLGGVAAGLANYFGWDPVILRIIFVVLIGVLAPVYVILWMIVPEAKTTADKLRMRGQPVNVDTIKQRFNDFKKDVNNLGSKENQRKIKDGARSIGSRIENIFGDFARAMARLLGIFLLFIGITMLVFFIKYLVTGTVSIPESASEELFVKHSDIFFDNNFEYYTLVGGICVLAFILMYGFITSGLDLVFGVRLKSKPVKYALIAFSVMAVTAVIYGGISAGKHYTNYKTIHARYELPLKDTVVDITVLKDDYFNNKVTSVYTNPDELIKVTPTRIVFGYPTLSIKMSETNRAYIEVERSAWGPRELKAIENCEAIDYPVQADTGSLRLSPVFSTSYKSKYREQDVNVILYVPKNTVIKNTNNMRRMFNPYGSFVATEEIPDAPMYEMTETGLIVYNGMHKSATIQRLMPGKVGEVQDEKDLYREVQKIIKQ